MSFDYYARIRIGIGFLIFFAMLSNLQFFINSPKFDLSQVGHDDITLYEKRFDAIKKMLPAHGTVGYAGGVNYPQYWMSDAAALHDWYLAQYTLAPLVLSIAPGYKTTVLNGGNVATDSASSNQEGFTTRDLGYGNKVLDFGNGVRLLNSEQ